MEEKYHIVFKGEIAPNADPLDVRQKLAALYKVDIKEVERYFSGKQFILKKNTDLQTARRYTVQFEERTGARCSIVKVEGTGQEMSSAPQQENKPFVYETRYRVMFNGELLIDKNIDEVKTNLCILYKVKPEKIEGFFDGKPVKITEATDFWTAAFYLNRFQERGAVCYLETVEPSVNIKTAADSPGYGHEPLWQKQNPKEEPKQEPKLAPVSEETQIKSLSGVLYDLLTNTYRQVQQEYKIEQKSKAFVKGETAMGCLTLLIICAAIAMVIWSPLRWYWALLGSVVMIWILTLFFKPWDTRYAEAFLKRMAWEKQKNFPLYTATLNKWVRDLPMDDRARNFLQAEVQKILTENPGQKSAYEKYSRAIAVIEPPLDNEAVVADKIVKEKPRTEEVLCPRCGSNWVSTGTKGFSWGKGIAVSIFLGPLAGAIAGSHREGEAIYYCESCGKEWGRR